MLRDEATAPESRYAPRDMRVAGAAMWVSVGASIWLGCSPFSSAPPAPDAGGAQPDGGGGADGAVPSTEGGAACGGLLCEDFEAEGWKTRWDVTQALGLDRATAIGAPSGSYALSLDVRAASGGSFPPARWIAYPLPKSLRRVTVRAYIRVFTRGQGELDLFGIATPEQGTAGLSNAVTFVHGSSTNMFRFEAPRDGTDFLRQDVGATLEDWTLVTISLDRDLPQATFRIAQDIIQSGRMPAAWKDADLSLVVGAAWSQPTTDWRIMFDDVTVSADE